MPSGGAHDYARAWEAEEDVLVTHMVASMGPRWRHIVKLFPGRTISSVRNRWQRMAQRGSAKKKGTFKNRCSFCGERKRGHTCVKKLSTTALVLKQGLGAEHYVVPQGGSAGPAEPDNELSGTDMGLSDEEADWCCTEQEPSQQPQQLLGGLLPIEDPILMHLRGREEFLDCQERDADPLPWQRVSLADAVVTLLHGQASPHD